MMVEDSQHPKQTIRRVGVLRYVESYGFLAWGCLSMYCLGVSGFQVEFKRPGLSSTECEARFIVAHQARFADTPLH